MSTSSVFPTEADPEIALFQGVRDVVFTPGFVRPEPTDMAALVLDGLTEQGLTAAARSYGLRIPYMPQTLAELDLAIPYFQRLTDHVAEEFPDDRILFAARDAEALYDDFAVAHSGLDARLLPASQNLIKDSDLRDSDRVDAFLARYGMSADEVHDKSLRFILVDSGFAGSIGWALNDLIDARHGVKLADEGRLVTRLVSSKLRASAQLISFRTRADRRVASQLRRAQQTSTVLDSRRLDQRLAVTLQLMPRYHGPFRALSESVDGTVSAVPRTNNARFALSIDDPGTFKNNSITHPTAAAITQYRVVRAALARTGQVPEDVREEPGQLFGWRSVVRAMLGG